MFLDALKLCWWLQLGRQYLSVSSVHANVMLYQSASGDAKEGTSVFTMTGGEMTSNNGAMFYCTNTASVINLNDVTINCSEDDTLLIVSAGRWGKDGKNGGTCILNAEDQELFGSISVDSISALTIRMYHSAFVGCINAGQEGGEAVLCLDDDSTWTLTADSYLTSFDGDLSSVNLNGYTLNIGGAAINN